MLVKIAARHLGLAFDSGILAEVFDIWHAEMPSFDPPEYAPWVCRVCGEHIPKREGRGRPALYHDGCRTAGESAERQRRRQKELGAFLRSEERERQHKQIVELLNAKLCR
jgi:hypothetical protein